MVSNNLLEPDQNKIDMLLKAPVPQDRTSLRAFLSLLHEAAVFQENAGSFITRLPLSL